MAKKKTQREEFQLQEMPDDFSQAEKLLEESKKRWMRLSKENLTDTPRTVMELISLAWHIMNSALEDKALIEETFTEKGFSVQKIELFRKSIISLWAIEIEWNRVKRNLTKTNLDELVEEGIALRQQLLDGAFYLWRNDENVKDFLRDIRAGRGNWDLADDLKKLADFLKIEWKSIKGRSEITLEMIKRSNKCADELVKKLKEPDLKKTQEFRLRAWNEFISLYEEIRMVGRFIYRHDPEKWKERYPSSFSQNYRRRKTSSQKKSSPQKPTDDKTS